MSIVTHLRRYMDGRRAERERRRTSDLVNALPLDIQKDIGWPGFMPETGAGRYRRFPAGERR